MVSRLVGGEQACRPVHQELRAGLAASVLNESSARRPLRRGIAMAGIICAEADGGLRGIALRRSIRRLSWQRPVRSRACDFQN